jgi:hypothetical protein
VSKTGGRGGEKEDEPVREVLSLRRENALRKGCRAGGEEDGGKILREGRRRKSTKKRREGRKKRRTSASISTFGNFSSLYFSNAASSASKPSYRFFVLTVNTALLPNSPTLFLNTSTLSSSTNTAVGSVNFKQWKKASGVSQALTATTTAPREWAAYQAMILRVEGLCQSSGKWRRKVKARKGGKETAEEGEESLGEGRRTTRASFASQWPPGHPFSLLESEGAKQVSTLEHECRRRKGVQTRKPRTAC